MIDLLKAKLPELRGKTLMAVKTTIMIVDARKKLGHGRVVNLFLDW